MRPAGPLLPICLFVHRQRLFQETVYALERDVFCRVDEEDLHAGAFFAEEVGVVKAVAFYEADVGLAIFFMGPEIAEHLFVVAEEGHTVFPGFGDIWVGSEDMGAEELQTAFGRLGLLEEIVVDGAKHEDRVELIEPRIGKLFVEEEDGEANGAVGAEYQGLFDVGRL